MGKSIYSLFGTDKQKERDGIIIDYGDGITFRVARMGDSNSAYMKHLRAVTKRYKHQIETDTLPVEKMQEIQLEAFVRYVLLGWENVLDETGQPIPFSEENAKKLMEDMPDLYKDLVSQASEFTNFLAQEREETAKNSESA